MWAARDKTNKLHLFTKHPYKGSECDAYEWHPNNYRVKLEIDSKLFPELKWEDEPIEVSLINLNHLENSIRKSCEDLEIGYEKQETIIEGFKHYEKLE